MISEQSSMIKVAATVTLAGARFHQMAHRSHSHPSDNGTSSGAAAGHGLSQPCGRGTHHMSLDHALGQHLCAAHEASCAAHEASTHAMMEAAKMIKSGNGRVGLQLLARMRGPPCWPPGLLACWPDGGESSGESTSNAGG